MAIYYVYSGAAGSANGSSWANAFTTLTAALATKAAGDTFYVAHDHAEIDCGNPHAGVTAPIANPSKIICVNRGGSGAAGIGRSSRDGANRHHGEQSNYSGLFHSLGRDYLCCRQFNWSGNFAVGGHQRSLGAA